MSIHWHSEIWAIRHFFSRAIFSGCLMMHQQLIHGLENPRPVLKAQWPGDSISFVDPARKRQPFCEFFGSQLALFWNNCFHYQKMLASLSFLLNQSLELTTFSLFHLPGSTPSAPPRWPSCSAGPERACCCSSTPGRAEAKVVAAGAWKRRSPWEMYADGKIEAPGKPLKKMKKRKAAEKPLDWKSYVFCVLFLFSYSLAL